MIEHVIFFTVLTSMIGWVIFVTAMVCMGVPLPDSSETLTFLGYAMSRKSLRRIEQTK